LGAGFGELPEEQSAKNVIFGFREGSAIPFDYSVHIDIDPDLLQATHDDPTL